MAHFIGYNTEDPNAAEMKFKAATANEEKEFPLQTDKAEKILGYAWSEQTGKLFVEQTFDGVNWDISKEYALTAKTTATFEERIFGPQVRLRFVNGGTESKKIRIFARTFLQGA